MIVMEEDRTCRHTLSGTLAPRALHHLTLHQITLLCSNRERRPTNHRPMQEDEQVVKIMIVTELIRVVTLHEQLTLRRRDREPGSAQDLLPPAHDVERDDAQVHGGRLDSGRRRQPRELLRSTLPAEPSQGSMQQDALIRFERPRWNS